MSWETAGQIVLWAGALIFVAYLLNFSHMENREDKSNDWDK